tara:strand:+ start:24898 stop:25161 length:264 start_codon:yes stop_codon:yes gene_type:complete
MIKDYYIRDTDIFIQIFLDNTATSLNYWSLSDVATCNVAGGTWEQEAKKLLLWSNSIWTLAEEHYETILEETDLLPEDFVNSLPVYA